MVAYRDRIETFMKKHGDTWMEALYEERNAEEVKVLYRMTSDMRGVNTYTKADPYPLQDIASILNSFLRSNRYSSTDIEDAFFTIMLHPASRKYTAFTTPHGRYEYACLPQGVKNAAAIWARHIQTVMASLVTELIRWYQDDVINYAFQDIMQHLDTQQRLYDTLRPFDMTLKAAKTFLNFESQKILGHIVSCEGRRADPGLVKDVLNLRAPRNITGVRSLLGLAQVAREYIAGLARILEPIQQLTSLKPPVDIPELWTQEHEDAFTALKAALTSAPVLLLPDLLRIFRIHCDASWDEG
jgi:hypothetical protein